MEEKLMNETVMTELATVQHEIATLEGSFKAVTISNQPEYDVAVEYGKKAKKLAKEIEDKRKAIVKPINDSVKQINDLFKVPIARLDEYTNGIKTLCNDYSAEQERIRLEEQRKADEAAQRERERIEAQARAQREKEERERQIAEEARRKAQEAANLEERQRLEREAEKAEAKAAKAAEAAEVKSSIASTVVAPTVQRKVEKKGVYSVATYHVTVKNKADFVRWAMTAGMLEYLEINEALLKREAQATKGERTWPGIEIKTTQDSRMRG
jgi:hypothetical protein